MKTFPFDNAKTVWLETAGTVLNINIRFQNNDAARDAFQKLDGALEEGGEINVRLFREASEH